MGFEKPNVNLLLMHRLALLRRLPPDLSQKIIQSFIGVSYFEQMVIYFCYPDLFSNLDLICLSPKILHCLADNIAYDVQSPTFTKLVAKTMATADSLVISDFATDQDCLNLENLLLASGHLLSVSKLCIHRTMGILARKVLLSVDALRLTSFKLTGIKDLASQNNNEHKFLSKLQKLSLLEICEISNCPLGSASYKAQFLPALLSEKKKLRILRIHSISDLSFDYSACPIDDFVSLKRSFEALQSLEVLDISCNGLARSQGGRELLQSILIEKRRIRVLSIGDNFLERFSSGPLIDSILCALEEMHDLEELDVRGNSMGETPGGLSILASLLWKKSYMKKLALGDNGLSDIFIGHEFSSIVASLKDMKMLVEVDLSNNSLGDNALGKEMLNAILMGKDGLQKLCLVDNNLSDFESDEEFKLLLCAVENLTMLSKCDVSYNGLGSTKSGRSFLTALLHNKRNLRALNICDNALSEFKDGRNLAGLISSLDTMVDLETCDISLNGLGHTYGGCALLTAALHGKKQMSSLELGENFLSEFVVKDLLESVTGSLREMRFLKKVDIKDNDLGHSKAGVQILVSVVSNKPFMESLDVSQNHLADIPGGDGLDYLQSALEEMSWLIELNAADNQLGEGVEGNLILESAIYQKRHLKVLNLKRNALHSFSATTSVDGVKESLQASSKLEVIDIIRQ